MTLDHIRSIVPVLVLQDHIFRVPFLNWYLNQRFQNRIIKYRLRTGVTVRPITVVNIHDLESIVHSAEGANFDFIYALHNRTVKDPEVLSELLDMLSQFEDFGHTASPRIKSVLEELSRQISSHLFPNEKLPVDRV